MYFWIAYITFFLLILSIMSINSFAMILLSKTLLALAFLLLLMTWCVKVFYFCGDAWVCLKPRRSLLPKCACAFLKNFHIEAFKNNFEAQLWRTTLKHKSDKLQSDVTDWWFGSHRRYQRRKSRSITYDQIQIKTSIE